MRTHNAPFTLPQSRILSKATYNHNKKSPVFYFLWISCQDWGFYTKQIFKKQGKTSVAPFQKGENHFILDALGPDLNKILITNLFKVKYPYSVWKSADTVSRGQYVIASLTQQMIDNAFDFRRMLNISLIPNRQGVTEIISSPSPPPTPHQSYVFIRAANHPGLRNSNGRILSIKLTRTRQQTFWYQCLLQIYLALKRHSHFRRKLVGTKIWTLSNGVATNHMWSFTFNSRIK